jgi:2-oxo-4-hydroxy-4-carboxy-5-ureidoimidazoline decarboxylase
MEPSQRLDEADDATARELLTACCGSSRWVDAMLARRPFRDRETLCETARREWFALTPADWREAFSHHPKIGDRESLRRRFPATRHLSAREQAGVEGAADEVLDALAEANGAYERRFGYIFIVCATGRSADEMLRLLQERLRHDPDLEIRVAAGEQARITEIRLLGLR